MAFPMKIQKEFHDSEDGARAEGFAAMLAKFQHRVCANVHVHYMHNIRTIIWTNTDR